MMVFKPDNASVTAIWTDGGELELNALGANADTRVN